MSRLRPHLLPPLLYLLVAMVAFWPASFQPGVWHLEGAFYIGELGNLFLLKEGLRVGDVVFTDWLNYPEGGYLVFMGWANLVLALVFEQVVSSLAAYNLGMLLLLALAGWSGYLLAGSLVRDRGAALLAGLAFGFNPFALSVLHNGQMAYANHAWLALYALALLTWLERGRYGALAAVGILTALNLLSCPYYAVFAWLFTPLPVLWWLVRQPRRWWVTGLRTGAALAVGGLCQVPPYLYFRMLDTLPEDRQLLPAPLCEVETAIRSIALGTSAMFHPEWGSAGLFSVFAPLTPWRTGEVVHVPYLGASTLLVLAVALGAARLRGHRGAPVTPMESPWPWFLAAVAFFVLALGPFLCVEGRSLTWNGQPLPLPFMVLWKHAPLFHRICTPYRFVILVALALTPLLAMALAGALKGLGPRTRAAALVAAGAALLGDYLLLSPVPWPFEWARLQVPSVYHELGKDPAGYGILEFPYREPKGRQYWRRDPYVPLPGDWNERLAFFQTVHHKRLTLRMAQTTLPLTYMHSPFARHVADLVTGRVPADVTASAPQGLVIIGRCEPAVPDEWLLGNQFYRLVLHEDKVPAVNRDCVRSFLDRSLPTLGAWPDEGIVLYEIRRP